MHDIKAIRDDPTAFDAAMARRGNVTIRSTQLLEVDAETRKAEGLAQQAAADLKRVSELVHRAVKDGDLVLVERHKAVAAAKKQEIDLWGRQANSAKIARSDLLADLPNILDPSVPDGADESANVELDRRGTPAQPKAARQHFELGEALGLMDFEAAARLSGSRFVVLRGAIARLERILGQWMLDQHTTQNGYLEIAPPYLVNAKALTGTGQLPKFKEDLFGIVGAQFEPDLKLEPNWCPTADTPYYHSGKYLIPTAEVPLTNLVADQIIPEPTEPLRFTALTPSFRSEAGSAGRDTRGMLRQHQFHKVELVSITRPEDSVAEHERMTECAERILTALGLTWRRMLLCAGDTGFAAAKTYDLEVWLPGQQAWREISSCSNCHAFQGRRMNARFKRGKESVFVHTLNGSGVAVGRALIAVMETHQRPDGSISIPEPLLPYMGGLTQIG